MSQLLSQISQAGIVMLCLCPVGVSLAILASMTHVIRATSFFIVLCVALIVASAIFLAAQSWLLGVACVVIVFFIGDILGPELDKLDAADAKLLRPYP